MFKPRFKLGKKEGETMNWVVQLSPILFKKVMNQGRVYIGLRSCRIKEYHGVMRCFKCQGLGHIGKYCRGAVTCFKCGEEGHHVSSCTKGSRECANCKRSGYKETGHSFSEHIEEYLTYLRKVKRKLKGEVVILSADANAKSELWGSPKEDSRGALLREVIEMDGWYIANDKRYGPTFDNGRTTSFIDITLTNRKVNTIMVDWEVRGDWITGTHKVITFKTNRTECRQPFINRTDKGNVKFQFHKANCGSYKKCLFAEKHRVENISLSNKKDIIEYEKLIRKWIMDAARKTMPRKRYSGKGNIWWDQEIAEMKREI
ncbi:hypothetical protein J437_LFUL004406 [Ladona fulva]|uniref:CCHC-type domain-containing protein n=1 Tax=Ladona fulva TaxID=123851 RepID=A0A8K0K3R0_LADFU|nr:hypothetical protein J437_LFUL004406 [Ladona fulva]